jgi:outer membrane protein assembly factor BamB
LTPNGTIKWLYAQEGSSTSSPSIAEDGTIYFGDNDHIIYALNSNGTEKWRYMTGDIVMGSPAIADNGTIYIGSMDRSLYALYPNGTLRWRFITGGEIKGSASVAPDDTIYIPSFDGFFYALYPNGTMKWRASTGGSIAAAGVALAEDGTIYVGTEHLRAFYTNGSLKWSANVQGSIYGTVPAVSADGTIYVSAGGSLVAVNPDGTERWRKQLTIAQIHSSPCIGSDDRVYVGSEDYGLSPYGYLHAFGPLDPNAPHAPTITGQINGRIKRTYDYTFTTSSPLGNQLYYLIYWGDGTTTDWLGPYNSGESLTMEHSWSTKGTYIITARAKDTGNLWGPWGNLSVTMPYQPPQFRLLEWLLERFPNAFPILRYFFDH